MSIGCTPRNGMIHQFSPRLGWPPSAPPGLHLFQLLHLLLRRIHLLQLVEAPHALGRMLQLGRLGCNPLNVRWEAPTNRSWKTPFPMENGQFLVIPKRRNIFPKYSLSRGWISQEKIIDQPQIQGCRIILHSNW